MFPTRRLLQQAVRPSITLFTRPSCSLCDDAKAILMKVQQKKPFTYNELDIMAPTADPYWAYWYKWETPVVHAGPPADLSKTPPSQVLRHRFTEKQVEEALERAKNYRPDVVPS